MSWRKHALCSGSYVSIHADGDDIDDLHYWRSNFRTRNLQESGLYEINAFGEADVDVYITKDCKLH
jgi:hypothetical protein